MVHLYIYLNLKKTSTIRTKTTWRRSTRFIECKPARTEPAVARVLTLNPLKITNGSTTITVFEENHGRSTSDVVRFRNGEGNFGITYTDINKSAGFTITKVDANNYTFVLGTATATLISEEEKYQLVLLRYHHNGIHTYKFTR